MPSIVERHERILEELHARGHVTVASLSEELSVSEVTIRKDLGALEERQLLHRTHGGARPRDRPPAWIRDVGEGEEHAAEKRRIAEAAAALVQPGHSVILAPGSTTGRVARHLRSRGGLRVVTSSAEVVLELSNLADVEVVLLGGVVRTGSLSVVGARAEEMLEDYACDTLFLGAAGLDPEHGVTTPDAQEALLERAMIRAARETVVVCDASKFGRRAFGRVCGIAEVDRVITDTGLPPGSAGRLEAAGVEVVRV